MKIRILNEIKDHGYPDARLLTEAVENIIPPSMSVVIESIKEKVPKKSQQDIFAKFVAAYLPVNDGTGKHFNVQLINNIFNNIVGSLMIDMRNSQYYTDWLADQKRKGNDPMGPAEERDRLTEIVDDFREQFEVGWIYRKNPDGTYVDDDSKFQSAAWAWADKYDRYIKPDEAWKMVGAPNPEDREEFFHDDPKDPEKALLTIAQAFKAHKKMCKKFFKKNPEFKRKIHPPGNQQLRGSYPEGMTTESTIEEVFFLRAEDRWRRAQATWWAQRIRRLGKVIKFLNADINNHNKLQAIWNAHPRVTEVDPQTGEVGKGGALEAADLYIDDWTISQEHKECADFDQMPFSQPCILKKFSNGKFWFNRASDYCNIAADKMANCGKANFDNSTILMLKAGNLEEGIKWHTMVEWNPQDKAIYQILGFANQFPEREDWEEIKWLWERLGEPKIDSRFLQHMETKHRVTKKQKESFFSFIGYETDPLKKRPKDWSDVWKRIVKGEYSHESHTQDANGREVNRQIFRFNTTTADTHPYSDAVVRFEFIIRQAFNKKIERKHIEEAKNVLFKEAETVYNELYEMVKDTTGRKGEILPDDLVKERGMVARIMREPNGPQVAMMRFMFTAQPTIWQHKDEITGRAQNMAFSAHNWIVAMRQEFRPFVLEQSGKDIIKATETGVEKLQKPKEEPKASGETDWSQDRMVTRWKIDRDEDPDEWRRMRGPARRRLMILIDMKAGENEHPYDKLDKLGEAELNVLVDYFFDALPSDYREKLEDIINAEGPFSVADLEDLEFVSGHFGDDGQFTPDEDENLQEAKNIVREILAKKNSGGVKVKILDEIKTTYKGGGGHLAYKGGKLPVGDNPKGPYPSGGETADKIGDYKIKVRTKHITKEPVEPVAPGKEPDMEFVEEKETFDGAGIIPFRGEGEGVEFLIGQSPQGWWDIFKGRIDEGETALDAARREFEEESSFSYNGPLEEEMAVTNRKVKAWLVEMPDLKVEDFDISKVSIISTSEKDKELNKKNPYEGQPEVVAVGWFKRDEAEEKMNRRQKPFIGIAFDKLNKKPVVESREITKLRIFDFDETIAFTSATTYVETPHREDLEFPDQESFDKWVKETAAHHGISDFDPVPGLEKLGYSFDFTEYAKVNNPQLNKKVVDHLWRIVKKNRSEAARGVYVMTARGPDSKGPIAQYLKDQGFESTDFADIITLAGGSKRDAIANLVKQHPNVNSIAFWDDSDRNISDVQQLRDMYPEMDIQINHVVHGSPNPVEEELLQEGLGVIGWHVSNEKNRQSIIDNGIRSSMRSSDDFNPDYGEGRVYFFSNEQMDRGLESAKLAMFEFAIVAAEPPYIAIPFNLRKVEGEIFQDPEVEKQALYGGDAYYLVGSVPPEAIIGSHIKHEDELKKETEKELKESKMKIRIIENKQRLTENFNGEALANAIINKVEKTKDNKKELDEDFGIISGTIAAMLLSYAKGVAGVALAGGLAKIGKWWHENYNIEESKFWNSLDKLFDYTVKFLATFGIAAGAKKILDWSGIPENTNRYRKIATRIQTFETTMVLAMVLAAAGSEIFAAVGSKGGIVGAVTDAADKAGLKSSEGIKAVAELFGNAFDAGEVAGAQAGAVKKGASMIGSDDVAKFNRAHFISSYKMFLKRLWSGSRRDPSAQQRLQWQQAQDDSP